MEDGRIVGELGPTGIRPRFGPRLETAGFHLATEVFMPSSRSWQGRANTK